MLSSCEAKNGSGDGRECGLAAGGGSQSYAGDPINTLTGNFDYGLVDLSLQTIAGPLAFQRSYASQATEIYTDTTHLGYGWAHNQDTRLIFETDAVWFKAHTANQYKFTDNGDDTYAPSPGVLATLTYSTTTSTYMLRSSDQSVYIFDASGQLTQWRNELGYGFDYTYANGVLDRVTEPLSGRYLQFNYTNDRLSSVVDSAGRQVSFGYDDNGNLTSFTDVMGKTWTYVYDATHYLTEVMDPSNPPKTVLRTAYDASGRAYEQWNGLDQRIVKVEFNPDRTSTILDALGRSQTRAFDARNTSTGQTDTAGYTTNTFYDQYFRPGLVTDEDGRRTEMRWSADGANMTYVKDPAGYETHLAYDSQNHLTQVIAPNSLETTFAYDGALLLNSTIHASAGDVTTVYSYTTASDAPQPAVLLKVITDPLEGTTRFAYDAAGQLVTITDVVDHETHFSYDALGRVMDVTDAMGRVSHYEYDLAGRVVEVTQNYAPARPQNDENQYNLVTQYEYDDHGRLVGVTDTLGHVTSYRYDDAGRLVETTDAQSNTTTYAYNTAGQLFSVTDPLTHTTTLEHDSAGRLWRVIDPLAHATTYAYNPDSSLQSVANPLGYVTSYQSDALKRVIGVTDNAGHHTAYTLDAFGNPLTVTDALNRVTKYEYDDLSRLARVIENYLVSPPPGYDPNATNVVTECEYDPLGNLILIRDANERETNYTYDELYRLWKVTDARGKATEFGYDALGNRTSLKDANGNTTYFAYDLVNRLHSIDYPGGSSEDVVFVYDPLGRLTDLYDVLGHSAFVWDALGRPTAITDAFGQTVGYGYDGAGNRASLTYPGGRELTYQYDAASRLQGVLEGTTPLADYTFNDSNRLETATFANGITSFYDYDLSGQLIGLTHQGQAGELAAYAYQYDLAGNRIQVQETLAYPPTTFLPLVFAGGEGGEEMALPPPKGELGGDAATGDSPYPPPEDASPGESSLEESQPLPYSPYPPPEGEIGFIPSLWQGVVEFFTRLLAWVTPTAWAHNQTSPKSDVQQTTLQSSGTYSITVDYTYDPLNRLTRANYSSGEAYAYTYDKVGNRTSQTNPTGNISYQYDEANRLTSVGGIAYTWDDNGNMLSDGVNTYSYDYANRLVSISNQQFTIQNHYNGLDDRYQQTMDGENITYTLDLAAPLSQVLSDGENTYLYGLGRIAQKSADGIDYFLPDALGSLRQIAGQDSSIDLAQSFDPFGNLHTRRAGTFNSYGFAGEWTDPTGLLNLRARYYAPSLGRFLTRDPFPGILTQPASLQPYLYALNNPVLYSDASGQFVFVPLLFVAAVLTGGLLGGLGYYGLQVFFSNDPCARWDWTQAALWGGAGIIIGAISGVVIYGGWQVGIQLGWWGGISTGSYTVYKYVEAGVTKYVGQTNSFIIRAQTHLDTREWRIEPIKGLERLSQFDARAVEQVLIEHYGLDNLYNTINSISSTNPIYPEAIKRGTEILTIIGFFER